MPTLIDSFLVEFGIDPRGTVKGGKATEDAFNKATGTARKSSKDMEDYGKKAASFFGSLRTEAVGLFLAFSGANSIKGFVENLLTGDAATGRLAKNLGEATQKVSAYQMVVKGLGGTAADANGALSLLAGARENLTLSGTTGHDAELNRLGVTREDLAKGPVASLEKIAAAGEKMKRVDFYALLTSLGIPDGAIESLTKGRKGLDGLIEAKVKDGATTDADAAAAQAFQEKLTDLENKITGKVRPALYGLVTTGLQLLDNTDALNSAAPALIGVIGALGAAATIAAGPYVALAAAIAAVTIAYEDFQRGQNMTKEQREGFDKRGAEIRSQVWGDMFKNDWGASLGKDLGHAFWERATGNPSMYGGVGAAAAGAVPGGAGGGGGGAGLTGRKAQAFAYFQSQGYTAEQARGIVAAMGAENDTLDPNRTNPLPAGHSKNASHAYGLGQWLRARQNKFRRVMGKDVHGSSFQEQLQFMAMEMKENGAPISHARSAREAAYSMIDKIYIPGKGAPGDYARADRGLGISGGGGPQIHVGHMTVETQATNGQELADSLPPAIMDRSIINAASRGLD